MNVSFKGRIVQVTESLTCQDAVSNHVLSLHRLFTALGLRSEVYSQAHDAELQSQRLPLEALRLDETDVVLFHFCGRSANALPLVLQSYCTRILQFHNVTPASFFPATSPLHGFCVEARQQLEASVKHFHRVWADSQFNLDELLALGAKPQHASVVPIIVDAPPAARAPAERTRGTWLFVGRVAPNKQQVDLVRLFAQARHESPDVAQGLILVDGHEAADPYHQELVDTIKSCGVSPFVRLAGAVPDVEREWLYRSASVYVSLSEHEGFGVPLIEAAARGLPVVALDTTAVGETLGISDGLVAKRSEVLPQIRRLHADDAFRAALVQQQQDNTQRFLPESVASALVQALCSVLPRGQPYRTVSVVICAYNRKDHLERALDYLRHQRSPAFEVIVVDGPSDDGSKEMLQERAHEIKLAHNPERNLSKSRNLAIELADGDVVAFIDDDALPFDDWVQHILAEYNARPLTTAGLGGPAYYAGTFEFQAEDNGINRLAEPYVNIDPRQIGRDGWFRYNTGTNATFTPALLREHGGFDEQFDYYLDESEMCFRLQQCGLLIGYAPEVVVRHELAQSHNRQGRLNYDWHTICKNTAYFVAAYSGLKGDELESYLNQRMQRERIQGFDETFDKGCISAAEHTRYTQAVRDGTAQGLVDALHFPRRRALQPQPGRFLPYPVLHLPISTDPACAQLHVCIITREFPPFVGCGGIGTLYYHLASELLSMGHRVTAIVPGEEFKLFKQGNIRVHFTPQAPLEIDSADPGFVRNMAWSVSAMARLAAIHAEDPVDIVDSALWYSEALATALLPPDQRPPLVLRLVTPYALATQINGWRPDPATYSLFMGAERALIQAADAVVAISESIADSVERIHGLRRDLRWHLLPCGIAYWPSFDVKHGYNELPQIDPLDPSVLESAHIVLFVGRLELRKGVDLILQAAPAILRSDPQAQLILAGRDVEGWAGRALPEELQGRVHFVGEVDIATREKLLARAHCLLFPSRYESFGLVPLEAFVHGVPVVGARAGAIPEVVEDGRSGLLFEAESAQDLARCTVLLLTDPALRARLSAGALARVKVLSSRPAAMRSVELYRALLLERPLASCPRQSQSHARDARP